MAKKRVVYVLAAVVLLLAAVGVFLWTNLDWIVKRAIERFGSQATGTAVRVRTVSLHPVQGNGEISGLTVANPRGFAGAHALSLGRISVRLLPKTIASNPVVIEDIHITEPFVSYERNESGAVNLDVIKKNLGGSEPAAKPKTDSRKTPKEQVKRLRIRKLVIENAKVEVRIAAAGGKPRILVLRRVEMADIGGKSSATPDEAAKEILSGVLGEVSREVAKAGAATLLEKGVESLLKAK